MSLMICHFRFSIFVLETFKFEWQCIQYLVLNLKLCVGGIYFYGNNLQTSATDYGSEWLALLCKDSNKISVHDTERF